MPRYKESDWKVTCDRCGDVYYASEILKEWTGFAVCATCWEPRHEVEQVPVLRTVASVPLVRPEAPVTWVDDISSGIGTWAVGSTFVVPPVRDVQSLTVGVDYDGTPVVRAGCFDHGFHSGDMVDIRGAIDENYNGEFAIEVIDQHSFRYRPDTAPSADENPATDVVADGIKKGINDSTFTAWLNDEYRRQVHL